MRRYLWFLAVILAVAAVAAGATLGVARLAAKPTPAAQGASASADAPLIGTTAPGADAQSLGSSQPVAVGLVGSARGPATRDLSAGSRQAGTSTDPSRNGRAGRKMLPFVRPADLSTLLPKKLAGYRPPQIEKGQADVSAIYLPGTKGPVRQVTIEIFDLGSSAKAQGFLDKSIKGVYASSARNVSLGAAGMGYFGTSGRLYAVLSWVKGTLAYQVLIEVESGAPADEVPLARSIAQQVG